MRAKRAYLCLHGLQLCLELGNLLSWSTKALGASAGCSKLRLQGCNLLPLVLEDLQ